MFDYNKVIVIGCSGSGKSTFSTKLADITGLPLYYLDRIYWLPDKSHLDKDEFDSKQREIVKEDRWIIDGNYRRTIPLRFAECELCIFFDLPTDICQDGVLTRDKYRADISCVLEPDKELISDIKKYKRKNLPIIRKARKMYPEKKFIVFHSRNEADIFLEELKKELSFAEE